ncbi:MAG: hypothetical protein RBR78_11705 [Flavobacteriaceae bacterium]|nr:hypothetical protein [Flavobacteriaceae bacterium]
MALLVFQRWAVCRQKPNVPFAGRLSFYTDAQRPAALRRSEDKYGTLDLSPT